MPPHDAKQLVNAMTKLAGDAGLRQSMGAAARQRYEDCSRLARIIPLLVDFYKKLMDPSHARNGNGITHPWAAFNA